MAEFNREQINKYRRGELIGNIALVFCAAVLIYFAVGFTVARVTEAKTLELAVLISAPVLMVTGVGVAAYCNLVYGARISAALKKYVIETCVENASLLHPERNSLTFNIAVEESGITLQTNGYKEKIRFDLSVFGKLSFPRKVSALTEIENRLTVTYCRLYERGAKYTDVCYTEREGTRRKSGKPVYIIKEGQPDKTAFKIYLKNS